MKLFTTLSLITILILFILIMVNSLFLRTFYTAAKIENVKKALEGTDVENIKTATEKLTTAFYAVSEKLYSQAAAQNQGAEGTKPEGEPKVDENGNVYDADYKVENENNGDNKQD